MACEERRVRHKGNEKYHKACMQSETETETQVPYILELASKN